MPAPTTRPAPTAYARARTGERGFTIVEILVVMAVVLVLGTLAMLAMRGAKGATYAKEAIAAGGAYSDAIAKFQADHAGTNPTNPGDMAPPLGGKPSGPKSLLGKSYLASIPGGVAAGRIHVDLAGAAANCANAASQSGAPSTANAVISYCPGTAPSYGVRVLYKEKAGDSWANAKWCWHGSSGRLPAC